MGILDDAIREHLELKRQHGAAEEELRQQEVEALGSPRGDAGSRGRCGPLGGRNGGQAIADESLEAEAPEAEAAPEPELHEPEPDPPEPAERRAAAAAADRAFRARLRDPRSRRARGDVPRRRRKSRFTAGGDTPVSGFAAVDEGKRRKPSPPTRRTSSRTRPTSSRRRRSTTGSGSSRSRLATSTSTRAAVLLPPGPMIEPIRPADRPERSCGGGRPPRRPPRYATQRRPVPLCSTEPSMPS